ncbi:MAG: acyl-CoA thioester hydrolase/BAAT C-terminal domain-containing protein [Planctomycetota bacterium]
MPTTKRHFFLAAIASFTLGLFAPSVRAQETRVLIAPSEPRVVGTPTTLKLTGLQPNSEVEIYVEVVDRYGRTWTSTSSYLVPEGGTVDPANAVPLKAAWSNADPLGPFWSPLRKTLSDAHPRPESGNAERTIVSAIVNGRAVATDSILRFFRMPDVEEKDVSDDGLVGKLFTPGLKGRLPAVIVVPGSGGGIPTGLSEHLASRGYVALALAIFGEPGLPPDLESIPLEYCDGAIDWLKKQPFVDPRRIGLVGGSKGGELALLVGSRRSDLAAVVAGVPSTYVFQSINDQWRKTSSWSREGVDLPFVGYAASARFRKSGILNDLYTDSLAANATEEARIPIEKIAAPVLMITGKDDRTWPSTTMCDKAIAALDETGRKRFRHLSYADVGHELFTPGYRPTSWSERVGGTRQGQATAQADAWGEFLRFLEESLGDQ